MGALIFFLSFVVFVVLGGVIFYQLVEHEDFFNAHDAYTDGQHDARHSHYNIQEGPWIRFWYNRGFSRAKYLRSAAVIERKKKKAEASKARTLENAKKKGWVE
jgi:hypothetical protein